MPYVDPRLRDCAIYLYPSVQMARDGAHFGGTGFLVAVPSRVVPTVGYLYAITNEHVIRPSGGVPNPVIRLNDTSGATDILNLKAHEWLPHPGGDDVAATALVLGDDHQVHWINREEFITREDLDQYQIGPGDECFMVGRQIYHDGKQRNEPVLRFGNLAMLPQPIWQPGRRRDQESFLVEMHTLSGFSGSPVIVHWVTVGGRAEPQQPKGGVAYASLVTNRAWLLGVDWGFIPAVPTLLDDRTDRTRFNSGMSAVVPAWKVAELLDRKEFAVTRKKKDQEIAELLGKEGAATEASAGDAVGNLEPPGPNSSPKAP